MTQPDPVGQNVWRVVWQHPTSPDVFIGDLWDRETAEWIARMIRRRCRQRPDREMELMGQTDRSAYDERSK